MGKSLILAGAAFDFACLSWRMHGLPEMPIVAFAGRQQTMFGLPLWNKLPIGLSQGCAGNRMQSIEVRYLLRWV
jgi:hypothetical protein